MDNNVFDPMAWASQNNASEKKNEPQQTASVPVVNPDVSTPLPDGELAKARATVEELIRLGANIADSYQDWWECGCALAELGPEGRDLFQAARYGNATGALSVTRLGTAPAMPTRGEIDRLVKESYGL